MVLGKGTLYMNPRPSFIHEAGTCVQSLSFPSPHSESENFCLWDNLLRQKGRALWMGT